MEMVKCIECEAAVNAILHLVPKVDDDGYCWVIRGDAARAIDSIPAADVRPMTRGKWSRVYDDFMKSNYDTCSCCGKEYFGAKGCNVCPNCGAEMEES